MKGQSKNLQHSRLNANSVSYASVKLC